MNSVLDKERIVAVPGFNRWLVPPAALAIHLSIGMAYGFSVFWLPLERAVGLDKPVPFPESMSTLERIFSSSHDWSRSMLVWTYTLFFVLLGSSAACFGRWVEKAGPRKAGVAAACCWGGGLLLSALGVYVHQITLLWLGSGVLGGIGLGLGYISPVSTLLRWFPDRRGLATGLAIMGFGGGAMIGAPLADVLMKEFATKTSVGVWETFAALGAIYFTAMMLGAFGYRLPPPGWTPPGYKPAVSPADAATVTEYVPVTEVHRTPQFWLMWLVLCLNVSAGIGVLGIASPMLQEVFGGRLLDVDVPLAQLDGAQKKEVETLGAVFLGLLSLFNILGRIFWASLSDVLGRKTTYSIFFLFGAALYVAVPWTGTTGSVALFAAVLCVIMSMYGGGFATIPAYLADRFGPRQISAIHGRLLTAWSVAGVLGPVVINHLREWQLKAGVSVSLVYNDTLYILAGLLVAGFVCNVLILPVASRHFVRVEDAAPVVPRDAKVEAASDAPSLQCLWLALSWLAVGVPMAWGVWVTLEKSLRLFG